MTIFYCAKFDDVPVEISVYLVLALVLHAMVNVDEMYLYIDCFDLLRRGNLSCIDGNIRLCVPKTKLRK